MYRQVFIPNEQNNNIIIPRRWYGKEVEVTIKEKPKQVSKKALQQQVDYSKIDQVLKSVDSNDVQEIHKIFEPYQFSFKNFKFNRDEANNYDYTCSFADYL